MIKRIANRIVLLSLVPKGSVCCEVGVLRGDYSAKILEICQPSKLILIDDWRQHVDFDSRESREFTRQRFAAELSGGLVGRMRKRWRVTMAVSSCRVGSTAELKRT